MGFMYDFIVRQAGDAFGMAGYGGLPMGGGTAGDAGTSSEGVPGAGDAPEALSDEEKARRRRGGPIKIPS